MNFEHNLYGGKLMKLAFKYASEKAKGGKIAQDIFTEFDRPAMLKIWKCDYNAVLGITLSDYFKAWEDARQMLPRNQWEVYPHKLSGHVEVRGQMGSFLDALALAKTPFGHLFF